MIGLRFVLCSVFVFLTILQSGMTTTNDTSSIGHVVIDIIEAETVDAAINESESYNKSNNDNAASGNSDNEREMEAIAVDGADSETEPTVEDKRFIHQACKDLSGCLKEYGLYQLSTMFMLAVTIFPVTYEILCFDKTTEILAEEKWKWIETLCPDRMTDSDIKCTGTRQKCRDLATHCFTEYVKHILYPGLKGRLPLETKIDSEGNVTNGCGVVVYRRDEFFPGNGCEYFKKDPSLAQVLSVPVEP